MIPIKKLKKHVVSEFKKVAVPMEIAIQQRRINNMLQGNYLHVPWGIDGGEIIQVRWNVKRERFDRISFNAFGKNHNIKL